MNEIQTAKSHSYESIEDIPDYEFGDSPSNNELEALDDQLDQEVSQNNAAPMQAVHEEGITNKNHEEG